MYVCMHVVKFFGFFFLVMPTTDNCRSDLWLHVSPRIYILFVVHIHHNHDGFSLCFQVIEAYSMLLVSFIA